MMHWYNDNHSVPHHFGGQNANFYVKTFFTLLPGKGRQKKIVVVIKFDHTPEKFKLLLLVQGFINVLHISFLRLVAKNYVC